MARSKISVFVTLLLGAMLGACGNHSHLDDEEQTPHSEPRPTLGLMTSLPLYWPLDAELADLASGAAEMPWQREVLESEFELIPLDTLSPIAAVDPDAPPTDPLDGLARLAVIQPRVLTPADNLALDDWVKSGGQLLLVLDPALAGHFDLPLGDPRTPIETALIPPVLARWGLDITYDEAQDPIREIALEDTRVPLALAGSIREITGGGIEASTQCRIFDGGVLARCTVGQGHVTVFADAEAFLEVHSHDERDIPGSHNHSHREGRSAIQALVRIAFD